jgi:hypothetical protein
LPTLKAVVAIRGKPDVEARRNSCLSITPPQASTPTRIVLAVAVARSVLKRHFWAVALVVGLVLGAALPLGFLFSGFPPVAAGREFRPSMRVPAGVDADGDRVDDRLNSEIAQRVLNRLGLAVC